MKNLKTKKKGKRFDYVKVKLFFIKVKKNNHS